MAVIVETERLILRRFTMDDVGAMHRILGDAEVMAFSIKGVQSRKDVEDLLKRQIGEYDKHGFGNWAVVEKGSGQLIGVCGLRSQRIEDNQEFEISYRFNKDWHGRGYATEAARAVRQYAFTSLGMKRVVSLIESGNRASVGVAQKNGMRLDREVVFMGVRAGLYVVEAPMGNL